MTTPTQKHTPNDPRLTPVPDGPYYADETHAIPGGWETAVRGIKGRRLCTVIERDHMPKESGCVRAAFIVRACNSHAALVAALTDATDMLRLMGIDMHGHDMTRSMLAALDQAKA